MINHLISADNIRLTLSVETLVFTNSKLKLKLVRIYFLSTMTITEHEHVQHTTLFARAHSALELLGGRILQIMFDADE